MHTILACLVTIACSLSNAAAALTNQVPPAPILRYANLNPPNAIVSPSGSRLLLSKPASTNAPRLVIIRTNATPSVNLEPKPGIYRSFPYSAIVIVPGPFPDDLMARRPGQSPDMPVVTPDLQLIPWPSGLGRR